MKFRVYLRVIGGENSIRTFEKEAAWRPANVSKLKRRAVWPQIEAADVSWQWQTEHVEGSVEYIEEVISQFVARIKPLAPCIAKYRSTLEWASLVIVGECTETEIPSGLYLSAQTISSMKDLGVDLDIDFVHA
jgi:hypothetical protein